MNKPRSPFFVSGDKCVFCFIAVEPVRACPPVLSLLHRGKTDVSASVRYIAVEVSVCPPSYIKEGGQDRTGKK